MSQVQKTANSTDKLRAVLVLVATLATIAVNTLAAMGYINGVTPEVISNRYQTPLTPAGYAFSIWSLIYLGLVAFSIYQLLPANLARFRSFRPHYIITCVLNCAWIYAWHYDLIPVSLLIILLLLGVLLLLISKLRASGSMGDVWLLQSTFGIYAGWVTAASLVNFSILLVYLKLDPASPIFKILAPVLILVAASAAVIVRIRIENFFYPLAIAWGLTAIAVKQSGQTAIVVAAAVGVIVCLVTTGSVVTRLKDASSE